MQRVNATLTLNSNGRDGQYLSSEWHVQVYEKRILVVAASGTMLHDWAHDLANKSTHSCRVL